MNRGFADNVPDGVREHRPRYHLGRQTASRACEPWLRKGISTRTNNMHALPSFCMAVRTS